MFIFKKRNSFYKECNQPKEQGRGLKLLQLQILLLQKNILLNKHVRATTRTSASKAFELVKSTYPKDLTLKEIREILEDPTSNNSIKKLEEKEKTTRAGLKKHSTLSGIVKKQLETGIDAFDAESDSPRKIKYTKEEKRIVNAFMNLNIDNMSTQEAMRALDSLINFYNYGRTGGAAGVVKTQEGVENERKAPRSAET